MAISGAISGERETLALHQVVIKNLQQFCEECDRFIKWQYRQIIRGDPSPEEQERVALLRSKIWQLERSWKMLYDPIPEGQADLILREVFPDEP